jgi:uncharacterized membrane protein YphA (DoxX/SURF4 family)
MYVRFALGLALLQRGASEMSSLLELAQSLDQQTVWRSWPLVGTLRPMELALWLGAGQFTAGMFLFGGLLTRLMAVCAAVLLAMSLVLFPNQGALNTLINWLLLLAALAVVVRGGGAGTMDSELGRMQRKSLEREAEREAARRAALDTASSDPASP